MTPKNPDISAIEWNCLEIIERTSGRSAGTEGKQASIEVPCSNEALDSLLAKGLIERIPELWLPLEMQHCHYRLTMAGKALLDAARNN